MIELLNEIYEKLKTYFKYNKDGKYNDEITDEMISLYSSILGYYSAKLDLDYNKNNSEKLEDKIMLQTYDKRLLEKLDLDCYISSFFNQRLETYKNGFYDIISFLEITNHIDKDNLRDLRASYENAYSKTVLSKNLNKKYKNKIYKIHEKTYKLINNCEKK